MRDKKGKSIITFPDSYTVIDIETTGLSSMWDEIIELVGLENTGKKPCGSFSLGMRQRLGIALAIIGDPKLIILDEPINGLDPQGIVEVRKMLETLRDEKR